MPVSAVSENRWDDHQWDLIDQAVDNFMRARQESASVELASFLPDVDSLSRRCVLIHLIPIDLEQRWQDGERCKIEDYLQQWPDLSHDESVVVSLLNAECRIRTTAGSPVTQEELLTRFPKLADLVEFNDEDSKPLLANIDSVSLHSFVTSFGNGHCGYADASNSTLSPGDCLGKFRIQAVLGRGGMGTVYLAEDPQLDRSVAIKVLHGGLFTSGESANRLLDEARAVAKLSDHEGIVPVYDVGQKEDGTCFLVMEYVDGETLADRIARGPIRSQDAVRICLRVAETLHYAHTQGFIHRDIKPGNILIDRRNRVRITDFGLATRTELGDDEGAGLCGTLPYMAPEQIQGQVDKLDARADLWALGIVLYEMVCGRRPFSAESLDGWCEAIVHGKPSFPRRCRRRISQDVIWICQECLKKDPHQRYASAAELIIDLKQAAMSSRRWKKIIGISAVLLVTCWPFLYLGDRYFCNPTVDLAYTGPVSWLATASNYSSQGWYRYDDGIPTELKQLVRNIYAANGIIVGAAIGDGGQWVVVHDQDGKRRLSQSDAGLPQGLSDALARIESMGGTIQDIALASDEEWIVLYRSGIRTLWEHSAAIPTRANETLEQLAGSGATVVGVGLFQNHGWVIFYRNNLDYYVCCLFEGLPTYTINQLKEDRDKFYVRHVNNAAGDLAH